MLSLEPLMAFYGGGLLALILVVVVGVILGRRARRRDQEAAREHVSGHARTEGPGRTDGRSSR